MAIPAYYSMQRLGSNGPDVGLVQTWLDGVRDDCSWYKALRADGRFGTETENAVKELQLRTGLTADGKVGRETWEALYLKYTTANGTAVPYPGVLLRSGDAGAAVRYVQQELDRLGYGVRADGKYGAKTTAAVQSWQTKNGLKADGIIGRASWEKMF